MTTVNKSKETTATSNTAALGQDVMTVLALIEDFGSLLTKETEALRKSDFKLVDMMQEDKRAYAKKYHALVTHLSANKDNVVKLDVSLREKLIRARTGLTIILNDNLRALEIAKASTRRLVDRILDVARKSVVDDQQTNYSAKGNMQAYKGSTMSLSLDTRL